MCDYSLQNVKSRAAKVGDKLTNAELWHGDARIYSLRRCEPCGLRSTRNGVIFF
jgi:hypothetical protein